MKDIYKKILISLSAFILVLSFSFGHLNTSKRFEVQASSFTVTQQVASAIAVFMAGLGIKFVQEPTLPQFQSIYDNLDAESQGILSSPTFGNNIVGDMIALPYAQAQTLIQDLVNTTKALDLSSLNPMYWDNGTVSATQPIDLSFIQNLNSTNVTSKLYNLGNTTNRLQLGEIYFPSAAVGTVYVQLGSLNFGVVSWRGSFRIKNSYEWRYGSEFTNPITTGMTTLYLAEVYECTNYTGDVTYTCQLNGVDFNNMVNKPFNHLNSSLLTLQYDETLLSDYAIALLLAAGGLTLPAPTNGWDNSESGDIDLTGWTKGLTIPDVGDVVVLGGLTAGTLAGLSSEAVLVPSDSQTPWDPSEEPDYGDEDPYNPPPATSSAWYTAWLAAIAGATAGMFDFNPLADALAAIQDTIMSIVQPMIDGMTAAFHAMLQTLFQPFLSAFSELFTWDIDASKIKIDGIRAAIFARIPCVDETLEAWYNIMAVNGSNLISSFTFFGETFSISSGTLLQAFTGFGNMIKQAFRFVFWFIFLKGMRRRVTSFLGLVSAER